MENDVLHRRFLREGVAHRGDPEALEAFDAETRRLTLPCPPGEHATDCGVYKRRPCDCPVTKAPPARPWTAVDLQLAAALAFMALGIVETPIFLGWLIWRAFR